MYEKKHIFKYKIKQGEPTVPSSPNHVLVILLKVNKIFWCDLKVLLMWLSEIYLSSYNLILQFSYIFMQKEK